MTRISPEPLRVSRSFISVLLLSALLLLGAGSAFAQEMAPANEGLRVDTTRVDYGPDPALRVEDGKILLSLEEAIEIALRRNLSLVLERYSRQQFELGIDQAKGTVFDTFLQAELGYNESTSPTVSQLVASQSESQNADVSVVQNDPIGGQTTFFFNNSRSESDNAFVLLNPSFRSGLGVSYRLPLLRNFGELPTKRGILIARLRNDSNRAFFEQQVASIIQQVEDAYWGLVEARDQQGVANEALSLADELDRRNRIQVEVGTLAPLELVQSEANIATRQEEIIQARTVQGNAEDTLRLLLNLDQGPAWDTEIVPVTSPATEAIEPDVAEAIRTALVERPELAQQRSVIEELDIDARFFRNQVKPRLDLTTTYSRAGISGKGVLINPDDTQQVIDGGIDDAVQQAIEENFDGWSIGLLFAMPLQNRAARAQRAIADLEVGKGRVDLTQLEQQIITEVRTAVRQVRAAAEQIESASVSERLQERNLDAEEKRYENGMSTSFQVTQIQEDLTRAKSRKVNAVASYRRALAQYYRAIGRLVEETGVIFDDAGEDGLEAE